MGARGMVTSQCQSCAATVWKVLGKGTRSLGGLLCCPLLGLHSLCCARGRRPGALWEQVGLGATQLACRLGVMKRGRDRVVQEFYSWEKHWRIRARRGMRVGLSLCVRSREQSREHTELVLQRNKWPRSWRDRTWTVTSSENEWAGAAYSG